jgi:LacI family transcriptional regulator
MVLNGKGNISKEVRERVMKAAQELGYLKNTYAAGIATAGVKHLAVLINEDYQKEFEWHLVRSIFIPLEAVLYKEGLYPIIIPVSPAQDNSDIIKKVVLSGAGGVFTIHFGDRALHRQLEDRGLPVVILNNSAYEDEFCSVSSDSFYGMNSAVSMLIDSGHRRIVYIDYERPEYQALFTDRYLGCQKAVSEKGLDPGFFDRKTVDIFSIEDIDTKVAEIMGGKERPTALALHDDYLAAKVYVSLQKAGVRIPEDISLIAAGDTLDYNQPFIPRISTAKINTDLMGELGAELMLKRLFGKNFVNETIKVKPNVIDRGSTKEI